MLGTIARESRHVVTPAGELVARVRRAGEELRGIDYRMATGRSAGSATTCAAIRRHEFDRDTALAELEDTGRGELVALLLDEARLARRVADMRRRRQIGMGQESTESLAVVTARLAERRQEIVAEVAR